MADPQAITVYKPGRSIQVSGKAAYDAAVKKGWSSKAPQTPLSPDAPVAQGGGQGQPGGAGGDWADPALKNTGFVSGMGKGINPFHETPKGLPDNPGLSGNFGADMFNEREIKGMAHEGNYKGAAGEAIGTAAGFFGPELLKGLGSASRGIRGLEGASQAARAAERAADLQREIKGPMKNARIAADFTQPIVDSLSKHYDRLHKLLDKEALPLDQKMIQVGNKMKIATEPAIRKLGEDLVTKLRPIQGGAAQTLMEFKDAHGMHQQIQRMLSRLDAYKIGQWKADLASLDQMIKSGKEQVAASKGVGQEWKQLGELWKQSEELTKAIASRMAPRDGIMGKLLDKAGMATHLPEGAGKAGSELAGKAGVDAKTMPKPGPNVAKAGGTMMQVLYPLLNALMRSANSQPGPPHGP